MRSSFMTEAIRRRRKGEGTLKKISIQRHSQEKGREQDMEVQLK